MACKFTVDCWMTNDSESSEVDHGFINNVYTAPAKLVLLGPKLSTVPTSYHSESEVEHERAEKVADKPATNGTALHVVRNTPDSYSRSCTRFERESRAIHRGSMKSDRVILCKIFPRARHP